MVFDARAAKLLKPGAHIKVDECPGLRLEATASRKTWTYRHKASETGLMKQIKIGSWPEVGLPDAIVLWQALRDRRDSGEALSRQRPPPVALVQAEGYTLRQIVDDYAKGHLYKNRKALGARTMHQRLLSAIREVNDFPCALVNRHLVFGLLDGMSSKPMLAKSVRLEMAAAWNMALNAGRLPENSQNWWSLVRLTSMRSKGALRAGVHKGTAKRVLSIDEVGLLFKHDIGLFQSRISDFLIIQLFTCTRGAEIVQMRPDQITTEADGVWWTLPKELTKGAGRERASDLRVPLFGRVLEVVRRRELDSPRWLFTSTSKDGTVRHTNQVYMQSKVHYRQPYCVSRPDHVRDRLTVINWSPHDLRRTGRTMLAALGCPNEIGEAILGHVQPGVLGIYNLHHYNAERRLWLTRLADRLEEIIALHA
jgi:hypothetical protein